MAAVLAPHVLGAAHAADRLVLAAIGALGDELEATQAVHADEAPGKLGGAQPRLTASGAVRALKGALGRLRGLGGPSQAAIDSLRHATRVAVRYSAREGASCPRRKSA